MSEMLRENGIVVRLEKSQVVIQTKSQLACSSCEQSEGCGTGVVEKYLSGKVFTTLIPNSLNAKIGDVVSIELPKSSITKASLVVYLLPLVVFFTAAIAASEVGFSEGLVILSSVIGLMTGLLVTKIYNQLIQNNELYLPKMVSIVEANTTKGTSVLQRANRKIPSQQPIVKPDVKPTIDIQDVL
jgi:sigma-E factor negative regulatory protein RseC